MKGLFKAWLAALAVFTVGSVISAALQISTRPNHSTTTRDLTWTATTSLLIYLLMAVAGGLFDHRTALAALPVPAVTAVGGALLAVAGQVTPAGAGVAAVAALVGTVLGWQLIVRVRARREPATLY